MATIPTCQQGIYCCGLFASYFTAIYFGGTSQQKNNKEDQ
jgi:hypothetical protein